MKREMGCHLEIEVVDGCELELQVAVSGAYDSDQLREDLRCTLDGRPVEVREVRDPGGGRIHVLDPTPGRLVVDYAATVQGRARPSRGSEWERSLYLRPSRYAEADTFFGFAATEFAAVLEEHGDAPAQLLPRVAAWVGARLDYVPGTSKPTDGASDTLLAGAGVCRDYSHLTVALLRALGVPARFAAVYAPGCDPMDFHAVAEALVGDRWYVADATCLAPRSSLVRIATGRDAADAAFCDNHGGQIELLVSQVHAIVDGPLPGDDLDELVAIT
ncbi:transglutaminase family protein [Nocardioides zeae]|uniref:Transglutaminase family protein n=1 Tax=Nocardioides imazamoxiresistens TaxID=3231893 RepID=A0ABU3PUD0_9ACTN|nr:transglutaminase family protein [Nocardioides zeae]MDT9592835.1 transglutaminase family protein [Nocardioides zeae]